MTDLSDPKAVAERNRQIKGDAYARGLEMKNIMNRWGGRRFMYELFADCHMYHNPFSTDSHVTAFSCGEMNVGQKLLAIVMGACPELYSIMIEEANERSSNTNPGKPGTDSGGDAGSSSERADSPVG